MKVESAKLCTARIGKNNQQHLADFESKENESLSYHGKKTRLIRLTVVLQREEKAH
jgi:hypothetical protein